MSNAQVTTRRQDQTVGALKTLYRDAGMLPADESLEVVTLTRLAEDQCPEDLDEAVAMMGDVEATDLSAAGALPDLPAEQAAEIVRRIIVQIREGRA